MNEVLFPPWEKEADEKIVADGKDFALCHKVIEVFVTGMKARIFDPEYSASPKWGNILRARLLTSRGALSTAALVTCWERDGEARIFFDFPCCGG